MTTELDSQVIRERRDKAQELSDEGVQLYPNRFRPQHDIQQIRERYGEATAEELGEIEDVFQVGGRIMAKRDYGKSVFFDLKDHSARIQCYVRKNDFSAEEFKLFKKTDIGDLVGISGRVFRTRDNTLAGGVPEPGFPTPFFLSHAIRASTNDRKRS